MAVKVSGESLSGASFVPTGTVLPFAGTTQPDGWFLCDGSFKNTADYPALYAVIGTRYGSGSGTFKLPDFRSSFLRGAAATGTISGASAGSSSHSHTTSSVATDLQGSHAHTVDPVSTTSGSAGSHTHTDTTSSPSSTILASGGGSLTVPAGNHTHSVSTSSNGSHSHSVNIASTGSSTQAAHSHTAAAGTTDSLSHIPPHFEVNYIIKF